DAGSHTFSATLKTAGSQTLTATDTVTSTISGSQNGISVTPAAATSLVVSGFASSSTAGTAGTVTVTGTDAYTPIPTRYPRTTRPLAMRERLSSPTRRSSDLTLAATRSAPPSKQRAAKR